MKNLFSRIEKGRAEEDSGLSSPFAKVKYEGILNQMVQDGELPPSEKVLNAIRKKEVTVDVAKAKWLEFKKGEEKIVGDNKGEVNKPKDLKTVFNNELESFEKDRKEVDGKPIPPPKQQQPGMPEEEASGRPWMSTGFDNMMKDEWHMYRKYASGLTMGIYEGPEGEAPSTYAAVGGTIANVAGFLVGGFVAGLAVRGGLAATGVLSKGIPGIGKAIKGLEAGSKAAATSMKYSKAVGETVGLGTKVAKHGKAIGALAIEGATLGSGIGFARSKLRGETWSDAMAQGVVDGAIWAGGAAVLYPVVAGVGGLFGKRQANKLQKAYGHLSEDQTISNIRNMGVDDLIKLYEKVPAASRGKEHSIAYKALQKIKATRPQGGPILAAEIARTPEIASEAIKSESKAIVNSLLVEKGAPLKFMYESSEALRTMVNSGDDIGALAMVKPMLMDSVKQASVVGDLATLPFKMDAKQSLEVVTARAIRNLEGKGIKGIDRGLFTDFFANPSKANLAELKGAVSNAKTLRQAMGMSPKSYMDGTKKIQDVRIDSRKASEIADDYLQTFFKTVESDGAISFSDIGKLNEANGILKSATVMNKEFSYNMFEGSMRAADEQRFANIKPELAKGVRNRIMLRSLAIDSADDLNRIKDIKGEMGRLGKDAGPDLMKTMKTSLKNAQASFSLKMRSMREMDSVVSGWSKADTKAIDDIVADIFAPTKGELGLASSKTSEYMKRFGYSKNPLYIRNGTELADMMSMMVAGGKDVGFSKNEPWMKDMIKPVGTKYFASIQRKLRTHFGYNNPFETMFRRFKQHEMDAKNTKKIMMDGLAKTGIARGSKSSRVTMLLNEGKMLRTSKEFLALKPEVQKKAIAASEYIKPKLEQFFKDVNASRVEVGLKPFSHKQNYMHHVKPREKFFGSVKDTIISSTSKVQEAGSAVGAVGPKIKAHAKAVAFGPGYHRTGKGEYIVDAFESFDKYLDQALEVIHYSKPVRELEAIAAMAPAGIQDVLNHIKTNVFTHTAVNAIDAATSNVVKRGAEVIMRKKAEGLILGSLNVVFQQATSAALSLGIDPRSAIMATTKMFSKEYDELFKLSRNRALSSPLEGIDFSKNMIKSAFKEGNGVLKSAEAGYNYYRHFMSYGFTKFDAAARKHAFTTACEYWKKQGGKALAISKGVDPQKAMLSYADDWADMIHGSFGKADKPEILRSTLGRAMMQFQSFTNNLATTMMYDMPRMAYKEGAYKVAKNLLEVGAAASIINEMCAESGIPRPFSLDMFIPFVSNYRYANSGIAQATYDYMKEATTGTGRRKGAATRGMVSSAAAVAFPGSKQVYKGTQAFGRITSKSGKVVFDRKSTRGYNKPMAMAFGSYPQYEKEKEDKIMEASTSKGNIFQRSEKKAKRYVKKKLFK